MPFQLTKPVTIGIGVSVCGVTGYLIYHMYQKWKNGAISRIDAIIKEKTNFGSIEKPIPKSCLKALLKNHGRARVMLEEISSTRITIYVINSAQEKYACIITGHTPQIEHAALLINEMVEKEDTVFTETIWVPQFAVGKIIGRGGANVQNIMAMSNARVQILDEMRSNSLRRVLVQGTFMQVNIAIRQIKKVIERVLEMNKALAEREARAQIGASGNVCPADESSSNQRSEELATTSGTNSQ